MQLNVKDFKKALESGEYTLIDVRTHQEQMIFGIIDKNQKTITYGEGDFINQILNLDKSKKYLFYCWHGNRSNSVVAFMKQEGFGEVYDLEGGIDAWNKET